MLKSYAASTNLFFQDLVADAIEEYLDRHNQMETKINSKEIGVIAYT